MSQKSYKIYCINPDITIPFKLSFDRHVINDEINPEIKYYWWDDYSPFKEGATCFTDNIPDIHWDNIRDNNKIFVYDCSIEHAYLYVVKHIEDIIVKKNINPKQIYLLVMDSNAVKDIKNIINARIISVNTWVNHIRLWFEPLSPSSNYNNKKFSALSRNHKLYRSQFFCELINKSLLKETHYTYCAMNPYADTLDEAYSLPPFSARINNELLIYIEDTYDSYTVNKIKDWLKNAPYRAPGSWNRNDAIDDDGCHTLAMIKNSDIHITIETFYDQENRIGSLFSEKCYKPIVLKKPFIFYSTPHSCYDFRRLGFKTFNGIIDETYDTIEDHTKRRIAIVNEMKRISELNTNEYYQLLQECQPIVEHNYQIYKAMPKTSPEEIVSRILNL